MLTLKHILNWELKKIVVQLILLSVVLVEMHYSVGNSEVRCCCFNFSNHFRVTALPGSPANALDCQNHEVCIYILNRICLWTIVCLLSRELKDNLGNDEPEGDMPMLLQTLLSRNPKIFRDKSMPTQDKVWGGNEETFRSVVLSAFSFTSCTLGFRCT